MITLDQLPYWAHEIGVNCRTVGYPHSPEQQTLCLAEEAGEAVGAIRRYLGLARRPGTIGEAGAELADVVIAAFVAADALDIDLSKAVSDKLGVVITRGWRQP